jgi:hypothetical protein
MKTQIYHLLRMDMYSYIPRSRIVRLPGYSPIGPNTVPMGRFSYGAEAHGTLDVGLQDSNGIDI